MMIETTRTLQPAIQYEIEVQASGRVELPGSFALGTRLLVFVIQTDPPAETFADLTTAAMSSTAFWENPLDDEDWNNPHIGSKFDDFLAEEGILAAVEKAVIEQVLV